MGDVEGLQWMRTAADHGEIEAQYSLAIAYSCGRGVQLDVLAAAAWMQQAAEQGHPEALFVLGSWHLRGELLPQDFAEAVEYLEWSAHLGHKDAGRLLRSALAGSAPPMTLH